MTSRRKNLYLTVGLKMQNGSHRNLGILRLNQERKVDLVKMLRDKLTEYELSLERDILGICCDGHQLAALLQPADKPVLVCFAKLLSKAVSAALLEANRQEHKPTHRA